MDKSMQVAGMYFLSLIGLIFFFYPADMIESAESGHWIVVLAGFLIHCAVIWAYMKGLSCFDRLHVADIFSQVGKGFAIVMLAPVAVYLLASCIIAVRAYSEVIVLIFLSSTPLWATMVLMLAVSGYMAYLGEDALLRTGLLLICLALPLVLFVLAYSFQHADIRYILPLVDWRTFSFSFLWKTPFLKGLFAFGGHFLFLGFIQPEISYNRRKIWLATLLLLPLFLLSVYVPLLTFGRNTAVKLMFPFVMTTDTIEINWLMFDRISMFFMLGLLAFIFLFLALLMWSLTRLVRFAVPVPAAVVVSVIVAVVLLISLQISGRVMLERFLWWNTILRFYVMGVIPSVTLLLGILHTRKGRLRHA